MFLFTEILNMSRGLRTVRHSLEYPRHITAFEMLKHVAIVENIHRIIRDGEKMIFADIFQIY